MQNQGTTPKRNKTEEKKYEKKFLCKIIDGLSNNIVIVFFLMLIFLYSLGAYLLITKSSEGLNRSKQIVIENQAVHIQRIDSIFKAVQKKTKTDFKKNHEKLQNMIEDSLMTRIPYLNKLEQQKVRKYVKSIIHISVSETAYHDWIRQIDNALMKKEASHILEESKCLFSLEFDKIQHEYETLSIWAGILTIVFLIFSFYSMFKAEDLVRQGRLGVRELDRLKEKADDKFSALVKKEEEIKNRMNNIQRDVLDISKKINEKEHEFSDKVRILEAGLTSISIKKEQEESEFNSKIKNLEMCLNSIISKNNQEEVELNDKVNELENRLASVFSKVEQGERKTRNLPNKVNDISKKVSEISSKVNKKENEFNSKAANLGKRLASISNKISQEEKKTKNLSEKVNMVEFKTEGYLEGFAKEESTKSSKKSSPEEILKNYRSEFNKSASKFKEISQKNGIDKDDSNENE